MCDEAKLKYWARETISRRQFGALAGAAAVAACAPPTSERSSVEDKGTGGSMFSTVASIETPSGTMDGFLLYPEADKSYPGVILWPDIAGVRRSKLEIGMRLASEGYAVLVVNPYYRDVKGEQFADFASFIDSDGFQKVRPWREKLTAEAIQSDAKAIVQWLDAQERVDASRGIGTQGYCMGGPFAIWTAAAVPDRVRAAASFHGGGLVRADNPMSPHKVLSEVDARLLIAVAQDDDAEDPQAKEIFAEAAEAADVPATVTVYEGDHGWTVPDSPAYAEAAAERAYADLLELYSAAL
ncbi:dienelactone hydrolase family protein [Erythrobacter sp. THAF29]|uniref:dienelactone hydrolase family protein n=1 Tax=Erythrobacter sp. THAF29 TaxID=2587851 RepID=UPI0012686EDF|nr:dienelactone hydrolase family protein [Erythrobacter sp. THAF29]QFT76018.1 Dienelactone hydrolase family protein [Erythrobacter sp. THAF29]